MDAHLQHLQTAIGIAQQSWNNQQFPDFSTIPSDVIRTTLLTVVLGQIVIYTVLPGLRRFVFQTLEAMLTIGLLITLIALVIAMPFGRS